MEQVSKPSTALVVANIDRSLEKAKTNFDQMQTSVRNACLALSTIQEICDDNQDEYAESMLVKVKATFEKVERLRKEITEPLDEIKQMAMEPEKKITPKAGSDSEYNRVKELRDKYANDKLKRMKEAEAKALAEEATQKEMLRLKSLFEIRFYDNINNQVVMLENGIEMWFDTISLEKFDTMVARFNVKPVIKREIFDSWFAASSSLSANELNEFITAVKTQYTYEVINAKYQELAMPVIDKWKAKLDAKKAELQAVEDLRKQDEAAAQELAQRNREAAEAARKQRDEELAKAAEEHKASVAAKEADEQMMISFNAQVKIQENEPLTGVRTKKIAILDPHKMNIEPMIKVLVKCIDHEKFKGIFKRDKEGNLLPPDANGKPIYNDWADELLSFFAEYIDEPVYGIEIKDVVSTIQKKKANGTT